MNVLFLDIDGVLNSNAWYAKRKHQDRPLDEIDPGTIPLLNRICLETGCNVVISSTWRKIYPLSEIRGLLNSLGFIGTIYSKTPILNCARGHEIKKWIQKSPIVPTGVCILDDDSDMLGMLPWLVKTDHAVGLTTEKVLEAIAMMERPFKCE